MNVEQIQTRQSPFSRREDEIVSFPDLNLGNEFIVDFHIQSNTGEVKTIIFPGIDHLCEIREIITKGISAIVHGTIQLARDRSPKELSTSQSDVDPSLALFLFQSLMLQ